MNNLRNIVMLGLLAIFFAWYGISWAYSNLYKEPRDRLKANIAQYRQGIENGRRNVLSMQQFTGQNLLLYSRSMPRIPNEVRTQYSFWFRELLKFCDVEDVDVRSDNPTRTAFGGWNYRFHIRGESSLDQLSRLLFEFYNVPYLHRITAMSITPVEDKQGRVTLSMTVDALSIPPRYPNDLYPSASQLPLLPSGQLRRLTSTDLTAYRVIADRNLLQAAKGGIDRADHAYLTSISCVNDEPEIWITIRTDDSTIKAKKGETVRIGSFRATVADILEEDVVFRRIDQDGLTWLLTLGDCLNQAFALSPEAIIGASENSHTVNGKE